MLSHIVLLGPIQPGELARRMGMDASTLTRNLRSARRAGLGGAGPRSGCPQPPDRRSRHPARALHAQARRHWKRAQLAMNEALGDERVIALHALVDHGIDVLAEHEDDDPASQATVA
jgi:hypothetical protein